METNMKTATKKIENVMNWNRKEQKKGLSWEYKIEETLKKTKGEKTGVITEDSLAPSQHNCNI